MTTPTVSLSPIPFWSFLDLAGNEAVNGYMQTLRELAPNENKPTYEDLAATIPYANPIPFDGKGQISGPIYWLTDGDPYRLQIYDSSGNLIKTIRNYFPPGSGSGPVTTINNDENYVINGQYRFNQGTITNDQFVAGQPIKVAEGGWDFIKNNTSATDEIKFFKFNAGDNTVEATPIYWCQFSCTGTGSGESYKYFRFKIPDVRFANNNQLTFMCWANSTPNATIGLSVTQHFGTGGSGVSNDVTTSFATPALNSTWRKYFGTAVLQSTEDKVIGTNGDSCLYVTISMPINQACTINFVNIKFQLGNIASPVYLPDPFPTTRGETMGSQIPVPAVDGSNNEMFLQTVPNVDGTYDLVWADASSVGDVVWDSGDPLQLNRGRLLCDGSKYDPTAKSSDNIPYSRLYKRYIPAAGPDANGPRWGNGFDYLSAWNVSSNIIRVINNEIGPVSSIVDGTVATGFTFNTIQVGSNTNYNAKAYYQVGNGNFKLYCKYPAFNMTTYNNYSSPGPANIPLYNGYTNAGTSGFTFTEIQAGTDKRDEISEWTISSLPAASSHLNFYANSIQYYIWFKVDGSGSDPHPTYSNLPPGTTITGIECDLLSTDSAFNANLKICALINQEQLTFITTVAASAMTAGSYFKAFTTAASLGKEMAYWYEINGAGTAPNLPGYNLVKIALDGTETNVDVANKTCISMMNAFFQTPYLLGKFLIGTPTNDPDAQYRNGNNASTWGDVWGTYGDDYGDEHAHYWPTPGNPTGGTGSVWINRGSADTYAIDASTSLTGRYRNMPPNAGGTWVVKY